MTDVAVLGCGPAGLLAALAVEQAGHRPHIFSKKVKSYISGAQFLHKPIPGLNSEPDGVVKFLKIGPKSGYALKVYGRVNAPTSWDDFPRGELSIWSLGSTYARLWNKFNDIIFDEPIGPTLAEEIAGDFPLVLSTIPLPALCGREQDHAFHSVPIFISSAPTYNRCNMIEYNGFASAAYYRRSVLFGVESREYGSGVDSSSHLAAVRLRGEQGRKPTWNTCDCHPDIKRLGRFGKWQKGILVHHAYFEALEACYAL